MNSKRNLIILFVALCVAQALAACTPAATPTSAPTAAPPPAPTATPEPAAADPAEVVQGFWDALEAGDVDTAMAFLAEDAKCRGACYITGSDRLRSYVQGIINAGLVTQISDVTVEGDTVTYLYKVFRNGVVVEENAEGEWMQVVDGKIIHWNNLHYF